MHCTVGINNILIATSLRSPRKAELAGVSGTSSLVTYPLAMSLLPVKNIVEDIRGKYSKMSALVKN